MKSNEDGGCEKHKIEVGENIREKEHNKIDESGQRQKKSKR